MFLGSFTELIRLQPCLRAGVDGGEATGDVDVCLAVREVIWERRRRHRLSNQIQFYGAFLGGGARAVQLPAPRPHRRR